MLCWPAKSSRSALSFLEMEGASRPLGFPLDTSCHALENWKQRCEGPKERDRERERDIYIYIYVVKLLSGPSLGISGVIIWAK